MVEAFNEQSPGYYQALDAAHREHNERAMDRAAGKRSIYSTEEPQASVPIETEIEKEEREKKERAAALDAEHRDYYERAMGMRFPADKRLKSGELTDRECADILRADKELAFRKLAELRLRMTPEELARNSWGKILDGISVIEPYLKETGMVYWASRSRLAMEADYYCLMPNGILLAIDIRPIIGNEYRRDEKERHLEKIRASGGRVVEVRVLADLVSYIEKTPHAPAHAPARTPSAIQERDNALRESARKKVLKHIETPLLTRHEAAAYLRIGVVTLWKIKSIPRTKFGRKVFYKQDDLDAWVAGHQQDRAKA